MNRSLATHGFWLVVTLCTFVAGSQLARPPQSERDLQAMGVRDGGTRGPGTHSSSVLSSLAPRAVSTTEQATEDGGVLAGGTMGDATGTQAATLDRGRRKAPPLKKEEIEALVLQSIKSSNPLERRKAFDRILEEMQADSFTVEQAMTIRKTMHENRASGEQWQNFDYAWGANDPEAAVAYIDEIPEQYREGYLGNMLPGLASADPQTAIDLFEELDPALQGRVRRRLFEGLIDNDVAVATDYIFEVTDPANFQWRPMDTLTREIVADKGLDPTLEWAAALPDGPLRGSAWSAAYAHWGATAPQAAVDAIVDMPPSADRNQAINGFISAHAHQDGEAAVIWAAEITSPGMRESAMVRAGRQFYEQDQQSAAEWFNGSGLPEVHWEQIAGTR